MSVSPPSVAQACVDSALAGECCLHVDGAVRGTGQITSHGRIVSGHRAAHVFVPCQPVGCRALAPGSVRRAITGAIGVRVAVTRRRRPVTRTSVVRWPSVVAETVLCRRTLLAAEPDHQVVVRRRRRVKDTPNPACVAARPHPYPVSGQARRRREPLGPNYTEHLRHVGAEGRIQSSWEC
jgi:hypothetical protein